MKKRRLVIAGALLLAGAMLGTFGLGSRAAEPEAVSKSEETAETASQTDGAAVDYIYGRALTEDEIAAIEAAVSDLAGSGGYLGEEDDWESETYALPIVGASLTEDSELPTSYDGREDGIVTAVETQSYSDCWAFAAMELLHRNAIKNGIATTQDFSERHLVYYAFHSVTGTPGQQEGEGTTYKDGTSLLACFRNGGLYNYAIRTLSSYVGAVPEYTAPYAQAEEALPDTAESAYEGAALRIKDAWAIPSADHDLVKSCILEYGGVGITYCSSLQYYNYDTAAQYCASDVREDHAVVLIGWDDNYSHANFSEEPSSDGAWLVKNNWGTVYGDEGYFWLSYEDASIAAKAYVITAESADVYDTIYQCDNTLLDGKETAAGELKAANVYTSEAAYGYTEIPAAVSVSVPTAGMECSVQLYRNSPEDDPEAGEPLLAEPVTEYLTYSGVWTIDLTDCGTLTQGDTVAVVVTLTGGETGILTDITKTSSRTVCTAMGGEHTSYLYTDNAWTDYGASESRNFRIKLLTTAGNKTAPEAQDTAAVLSVFESYLADGEVNTLYHELLNRDGEETGIAYWEERQQAGDRPAQILAGFLYSEEYGVLHPEMASLITETVTACVTAECGADASEIAALYREILGREYDLAGLIYWTDRYAGGETLDDIRALFCLSEEYALNSYANFNNH